MDLLQRVSFQILQGLLQYKSIRYCTIYKHWIRIDKHNLFIHYLQKRFNHQRLQFLMNLKSLKLKNNYHIFSFKINQRKKLFEVILTQLSLQNFEFVKKKVQILKQLYCTSNDQPRFINVIIKAITQSEQNDLIQGIIQRINIQIFNSIQIHLQRGEELRNKKKYQEAVNEYDKVILQNNQITKAYYNKSKALIFELKKFEEANQLLELTIQINPSLHESWLLKGKHLMQLKQYDEAIKCFYRCNQLRKNDELDNQDKNCLSMKSNQNLNCLEQSIRLQANDFLGYFKKGNALCRLQQYDLAIKCCIELQKKAYILLHRGEYDLPLQLYDQYIQQNPKNEWCYKGKAFILIAVKEFEFIQCCDQFIQLYPKNK